MTSTNPTHGRGGSSVGKVLVVETLIAHQKVNIRLLSLASILMFLLGGILFMVLYQRRVINEIGPALSNLLTFVSGLFPVSGVIAANSRIGELKAAKILASQIAMSAYEEDLFKELLKR